MENLQNEEEETIDENKILQEMEAEKIEQIKKFMISNED